MKRNAIQPVKGTRDFYPEAMAQRVWLYERIRAIARRFGYQEYEGPILEPIALYAAKSGDELVKEQAFVLTDRGGDELALRPELTPTLARMVAQQQAQTPPPDSLVVLRSVLALRASRRRGARASSSSGTSTWSAWTIARADAEVHRGRGRRSCARRTGRRARCPASQQPAPDGRCLGRIGIEGEARRRPSV